jgi:hypothetical protein
MGSSEKDCGGGGVVLGGKGGVMEIGAKGVEASLLDEKGGRHKKEVDSMGEYEGLVDGL